MTLDDFTVAVRQGTGLVGRFPTAVLLLPDDEPPGDQDRLISLFTEGPDIGPRLAALFADPAAGETAAFAAVVQGPDGMTVYVHGPLEVAADGPTAELRVRGGTSGGLRRYDIPDDITSLVIGGLDGRTGDDGGTTGLRMGLVNGGGVVLRRASAEPMAMASATVARGAADSVAGSAVADSAVAVRAPGPDSAIVTSRPEPAMSGAAVNGMAAHTANGWAVATTATATPAPPRAPFDPPSQQAFRPPATTFGGLDGRGSPARQAPVEPSGPPSGAPTPNWAARVGARLLTTAVVGGVVTLLLAFVLPVGFAPFDEVVLSGFVGLGLLFALGAVLWDTLYEVLRKRRARQDWPEVLFVALAVPEAALAWAVQVYLLPSRYLVDEIAAAINLGAVAVLAGAATLLLGRLPATRRLLHRGQPRPAEQGSTGPGSPRTERQAVAAPDPAQAPLVWGINCQQGHFNRPDARYCAACGTAMHGLTHEPRQAPRPALGYLIGDDGASHVLDRDLVLGTAPRSDPKVSGGAAAALVLPDGTGLLGDAHTDIVLNGWNVTVVDRGHSQGTHVREPDSATWVRLAPGQPFTVTSGSRIRLGTRDLTYHAANTR